MDNIDFNKIKYLMLKRQHFMDRADEKEYEEMFRLMSPVHTKHWIVPGSPPVIEHRSKINDYLLNSKNRKERKIIKGRFQGGSVGYIYAEDLPLYSVAYKKKMQGLTENDELILNTLEAEGPMNIGLLKEITGLLAKQITPSLHKMQKAFILFEDQVDDEWDRSWYLLEDEFESLDLNAYSRMQAFKEVISRFTYMNVFMDETMVKSFTKLNTKDINTDIKDMLNEEMLLKVTVNEESGFILKDDLNEIEAIKLDIPDDVYILDLNDYLVKSNELKLKKSFGKKPYKTLYYIMKKGEFIGAVLGYFRFGADDLEDIELNLPITESRKIKGKIIDELNKIYYDVPNPLKKFCGERII